MALTLSSPQTFLFNKSFSNYQAYVSWGERKKYPLVENFVWISLQLKKNKPYSFISLLQSWLWTILFFMISK